MRSLVPINYAGGTFNGNLTGGANPGFSSQTLTYQFWVPWGRPSLNLGLQLTDPNYHVVGLLTDPNGQPLDIQSTAQFDASDSFLGYGPTMQFFRGHPQGGLWTVTLLVLGPLTGERLSEPFHGQHLVRAAADQRERATRLPWQRPWLPPRPRVRAAGDGDGPGDQHGEHPQGLLPRPAPERAGPRSCWSVLIGNVTPTRAPLHCRPVVLRHQQPIWFVPPGTNSLTMFAQGNVPIVLEASANFGNPDAIGPSFGNAAVTRITAPEVNPGFFAGIPEAQGPFGADGVPAGSSVNLAAVANTNPFDCQRDVDLG